LRPVESERLAADVLTYIYGFALVAAFVAVWVFGMRAFVWLVFAVSSLFPHIGRKHRHARWDELNRKS
jgi:hypothetical protein